MKKVLAIPFVALLCSCAQTTQNDEYAVGVTMAEEQDVQVAHSTIFEQVADSIYKLHPGDIENKIIQEDIAKDLEKYCLQFKGKHMPLIEELSFKLNDVVPDKGKYAACFKYGKDEDKNNLGLELQILVHKSRDEAAKLYKGKNYTIKGIMAGFPYSSSNLHPYVLTSLNDWEKPTISLGCIKVDKAELTMK